MSMAAVTKVEIKKAKKDFKELINKQDFAGALKLIAYWKGVSGLSFYGETVCKAGLSVYKLTDEEIKKLHFTPYKNPYHKYGPPMQIFLVREVLHLIGNREIKKDMTKD